MLGKREGVPCITLMADDLLLTGYWIGAVMQPPIPRSWCEGLHGICKFGYWAYPESRRHSANAKRANSAANSWRTLNELSQANTDFAVDTRKMVARLL